MTAPDSASGGQEITVSWTVENIGSDPASVSGWYDQVLLSTDTSVSGDDTVLASYWTGPETPLAAGASYTVSRTFTLPTTATGNLYLLFVTDRYNAQGETNETNNMVVHPISLNAPDLALAEADSPAAAILGETITVSWTVENLGEHPALAAWLDRVYISSNTSFDPATDLLLHTFNPSAHRPLAAGDSYAVTRDLLLPEGPTGSLYLLFVTDATGVQGETDKTNNVVARPITLTAPDLTVTSLEAPAEAIVSERVTVSWTVRNIGSEPALAGWIDRLYLSPVAGEVAPGSIVVVSQTRAESLAAGAEYTVELEVTVPAGATLGSWNWVLHTDATRVQGETDETNNLASAPVSLEAPDLTVTAIEGPAAAAPGQTITISWTVTNIGGRVAPADWWDALVIATNEDLSGASILSTVSITDPTPLPAGHSYTISRTVTLPANLSAGDYYLGVHVDYTGAQGESDTTNNSLGRPISISVADLTVVSAQAPVEASINETITVSWVVENLGPAGAFAVWWDRVTLSTQPTPGSGAVFLKQINQAEHLPLGTGATYTTETTVDLSVSTPGEYYLIFHANAYNNLSEADTANNYLAIPITLSAPDLEISALEAASEVAVSQTVPVTWTVENIGSGRAAGMWYDRIYLSGSPTLDGSEVLVGTFWADAMAPLEPGASYTRTQSVVVPASLSGSLYWVVVTNAGQQQGETDMSNNLASAPVTLSSPDLEAVGFLVPSTAAVGESISVSWTVANTGEGTAHSNWLDAIYLSDTPEWTGSGTLLSSVWISAQTPLAPGTNYALTRSVSLPADVTGAKYLILVVDRHDYQAETDTSNNWLARPITISNPDLVMTAASVPAAVSWGQTVSLSWTVENQGSGAAVASWHDRVYVSTSADFDVESAVLVTSYWAGSHRPLAPDASYAVDRQVVLPSGLTGTVYFHFVTDATGAQAEADETNNLLTRTSAFSAANLVLTSATAPGEASWGERINLSWTVQNLGDGPAMATHWWDLVYLSENDQFDSSTDILLTSFYRASGGVPLVNDGIGYTATRTAVTVPGTISVGERFLIFVTDGYNSQAETSTVDNVLAVPITIGAPDLHFDPGGTVLPATGVSGKALELTWTVRNAEGAGVASAGWTDRVYLSSSPDSIDGATVLASVYRAPSALTGGSSYEVSRTVFLPGGLTGERYLIVVTDVFNQQPESDATNNRISQALALSAPDLELSDVSISSSTVANGEIFNVSYTVTNIGTASVDRSWVERIILSSDLFIGNSDDILVANYAESGPLAPGESLIRSFDFQIPWGVSGLYNLFIRVDHWNNVPESNESNNKMDFVKESETEDNRIEIVYADPPANLKVDAVTIPATALSGSSIEVAWRVGNHGTATTQSSNWQDRVYLSSSSTLNLSTAVNLGTFPRSGALASGATYSQLRTVTLPVDLLAQDYWIFVYTDIFNQVLEPGAEDDNTTRSLTPLSISLAPVPDLEVTALVSEANAVIGRPMEVSWTVINTGGAEARANWTDRLYLSADGQVAGATLVGSFSRTANLAAGASYTRTETVTVPVLADGSYSWVLVTDAQNHVFERGATSNNTLAGPVLNLMHPDLVVTDVSVPLGAESGETVAVSWTVSNQGSGTAFGGWVDEIWASPGPTLGSSAIKIGSVERPGNLAAGAQYEVNTTAVLPDGIEGAWHLLIFTDGQGVVEEGAAGDNNITASPSLAVTLAAYPDLEVSGVTTAQQIIGDPADITVSWTVSNIGDGAGRVDTWVDRVVLSRNDIYGDSDDLVIAEFTHFGLMPAGTSYTRTEAIQLPLGVDNRYTLFVVTDAYGEVYEHVDIGSNIASPAHRVDIMRRPYADLVMENVVAPESGSNGMPINLSWTVANRGIGQTSTPEWRDEVFYSTAPDGTGLKLLQSFTRVGHLGVDATYTRSVSLVLPKDLAQDFYLYVKTSGPYEFIYNDEGNMMRSDLVTLDYIAPPEIDLTVTHVSVTPTAFDGIARDGQTVDLTWTVRNEGEDAAVGTWSDAFFLAPDGDRSKSIRIGEWTLSQGLEAGKSYTRTVNLRLPLHISGVYEVYVHTDFRNQVAETDATNNAPALAVDLTVALTPRPDLAVTMVEAPESVTSGTVIDVNWVVTNLSQTSTPTGGSRWVDGVYLSLDNKLDGGTASSA